MRVIVHCNMILNDRHRDSTTLETKKNMIMTGWKPWKCSLKKLIVTLNIVMAFSGGFFKKSCFLLNLIQKLSSDSKPKQLLLYIYSALQGKLYSCRQMVAHLCMKYILEIRKKVGEVLFMNKDVIKLSDHQKTSTNRDAALTLKQSYEITQLCNELNSLIIYNGGNLHAIREL